MNKEDLAWAAGFFDGEGCFSVARTKGSMSVKVTISQAHPEVLDRFRDIVGRGTVLPKTRPINAPSHHKDQWSYQCQNFEGVQYIYTLLWNWLGTIKREQGKRALVTYRNRPLKVIVIPKRNRALKATSMTEQL